MSKPIGVVPKSLGPLQRQQRRSGWVRTRSGRVRRLNTEVQFAVAPLNLKCHRGIVDLRIERLADGLFLAGFCTLGCSGPGFGCAPRKKLSAALTGRKLSPYHVERIRAAATGRKASPQTKEKMSAARKGLKHGPQPEEVKAKIQSSRVGQALREETKA